MNTSKVIAREWIYILICAVLGGCVYVGIEFVWKLEAPVKVDKPYYLSLDQALEPFLNLEVTTKADKMVLKSPYLTEQETMKTVERYRKISTNIYSGLGFDTVSFETAFLEPWNKITERYNAHQGRYSDYISKMDSYLNRQRLYEILLYAPYGLYLVFVVIRITLWSSKQMKSSNDLQEIP